MQNNETEQALTALLNELTRNTASTPSGVTLQPNAGVTTSGNEATKMLTGYGGSLADARGSATSLNAGNNNSELENELQRLTGQVTLLRQVNELNQQVLGDNTKALGQAATNQNQSSGNGAANTAKSIGSYLLGGLGIGPLISGITNLFGGGGPPTPTPAVKYSPPPALQYQGAVMSGGQISGYDYNDRGGIRTMDSAQTSQAPQSSPQVIVQVNAMDSRSFLDHSDDIARAVRAAILNSSSLNDVISEM